VEFEKKKKIALFVLALCIIVGFYLFVDTLEVRAVTEFSEGLPLVITTILIAGIDGFNPCNIFVLGMLLLILLQEGQGRKKLLTIGLTFVGVVYIIYFFFMSAWLNIIQLLGVIKPMRIAIAIIAIIAGIINFKERFAYRKGVTLMISDKYLGKLREKIKRLGAKAKTAKTSALMASAALLAIFASLIELPCTAGFPLIYTGILSAQTTGVSYYAYLALYNFVYVIPLIVIVSLFSFGLTKNGIKKETMGTIKYVAGLIMILLGILLLTNPALLGMG
jgi:cytochrome c biogenesis protein CcdA